MYCTFTCRLTKSSVADPGIQDICCGSRMFIPDLGSEFFQSHGQTDPGSASKNFPSQRFGSATMSRIRNTVH